VGIMNGRLIVITISTLMILGASSIAVQNAFAQEVKDDLKWQLVVLSSNPACSNYDYQSMNKYTEISEKYLEFYQVENSMYEPLCFSETKYLSEYNSPSDLDLLLLVYDKDIGKKELHSQKIGGYYHHFGNDIERNHVVVICDCPTFNYSNPVWILSHELSHFALYYLDYDESVIEDLVHSSDERYDQCIANNDGTCKLDETHVRLETLSASFSVMPIYEPAIGKDRKNIVINKVSSEMKELEELMTSWLTSGTITQAQYSEGIRLISATGPIDTSNDSEIHFADSAIDDSVTWEDLLSSNKHKPAHDIFSLVPDEIKTIKVTNDADKKQSLQDWFKKTGVNPAEPSIINTDFMNIDDNTNTDEILKPSETLVTNEQVENEFQIDFQTQQDYIEELKNKRHSMEKVYGEQKQQEIDTLKQQLELHLKALKYYYHGNYAQAALHYDKVLEVDPHDSIAAYNIGVNLAKQNLFEESIVYFNKVLEIESSNLTAEPDITNVQESNEKIKV